MVGRQGSPGSGDLERLTRKMQITAYVSGGLAVFCMLSIFTPGAPDAAFFFALLFYPAMFVLLVSSVGSVVGRLLLAARRDEQPAGASQDWYE
jgi:membrane protein YqaA with SNARE-associated domain